jgi:cell pole-organizing protein PopZ
MADKTPEQEPSIEEILASIRQIISDDEDKDDAVQAPPIVKAPPEPAFEPVFTAAPAPEPEPEDDVLELTETIQEEPVEIAFETAAPEPAPLPPRMETPKETSMDDILTESARNATLSSMAKLAGNMPITRHREYGNITLEDLVREMLHPMLKDWLSASLPPMVERMVQKELEKLARQAQDV